MRPASTQLSRESSLMAGFQRNKKVTYNRRAQVEWERGRCLVLDLRICTASSTGLT